MRLKKQVKKDFETAINVLKIIILVLCVVGCTFEICRAFVKYLRRDFGTTLELVPFHNAQYVLKNLSSATCVHYEGM